jgi:hypothetical protein
LILPIPEGFTMTVTSTSRVATDRFGEKDGLVVTWP